MLARVGQFGVSVRHFGYEYCLSLKVLCSA